MTTRPAIRPPAAWHAPAPAASTLANGLRVLAFRMPGQYVTSVALVADLPMTAEPRDREGVGALTAGTLDQGTATHPGTAFADAVEACGAILHAGSGHSHVAVHLDVPTTHLAPAASLLAEALADPELADADVDRHRRLRLAQLEQQRARGADRANQVFRHVLIDPALRSQRLAAGEADTVAAVTGADMPRLRRPPSCHSPIDISVPCSLNQADSVRPRPSSFVPTTSRRVLNVGVRSTGCFARRASRVRVTSSRSAHSSLVCQFTHEMGVSWQ